MKDRNITLLHLMNGLLTFSYAVVYSTLTLFLSKNLGYTTAEANSYVGVFLACNFALHLIAGYLSDHYFSNRSLLAVSGVFQIAGTYILGFSAESTLISGLSLVILGCGINTTALKCLLTQQFAAGSDADSKREKAFFINYAAMNAGFLLGFFAAGYFDMSSRYTDLFYVCNAFNLLAMVCLLSGWKQFKEVQSIEKKFSPGKLMLIYAVLFGVIFWGFKYFEITNILIVSLCLLTIFYLLFHMKTMKDQQEKRNVFVFLILVIASIIFWTLFFIGPMGLTYFLKNNVAELGIVIPPQWYMNLNSIFVIAGSPVLAGALQKLRQAGWNISIVKLFSYAIFLIAASYFALSVGIWNADASGRVSAVWVVLHFLLQAIGELFIAPVGYAMVGKFAPRKLQGMMMGFWMLVSGIAASLAQYLSNLHYTDSIQPLITNTAYLETFNNLVFYAVLFGIVLISFSKKIERLV